ncbi:MAG: hypothetical protein ACM3JB_17920 [Acidobacteriaceae bacterium]
MDTLGNSATKALHILRIMLWCSALLATVPSTAQLSSDKRVDWNLPDAARVRLEKAGTLAKYALADRLNPFYLRGDYDGDGKPDYAVFVINKATKKHGIVVVKSSTTGVDILGAGGAKLRVGTGSDSYLLEDFDWMDEWYVQRKQRVSEELGSEVAAIMRDEGIVVGKSESASALVFWNGKRWLWRQMGD